MSKPTFIDFRAVKRKVTMIQVLQHYDWMSKMRRKGDSLWGPCPIIKGESSTAFRVSINKNCWYCFGHCHCGGNVLDFVVKRERIPLFKAAHLLVQWFNLQIDTPVEDHSIQQADSPKTVHDRK